MCFGRPDISCVSDITTFRKYCKLCKRPKAMPKNVDKFSPGHFYHIYNRTNSKEKLFTEVRNYHFFLKKFDEYLEPVLKTHAYCLMGNHFHFLVEILEEDLLFQFVGGEDMGLDSHKVVTAQFRKFFITYSKAFNKQEDRIGSLFQRPFKRVLISSDEKYSQTIFYIHANPELHKIVDDFRSYEWSSYQTILSSQPTRMPRSQILDWFGGSTEFIKFHEENIGDK